MEVWVFGNPDVQADALPLVLLPALRQAFPALTFVVRDPQDEWPAKLERLTIIDTIRELEAVQAFSSLEQFVEPPRFTLHDFDLLGELKLRHKLGRLPPFVVLGVPPQLAPAEAVRQLTPWLRQYAG